MKRVLKKGAVLLLLAIFFWGSPASAQSYPGYGQDTEGKPRVVLITPSAATRKDIPSIAKAAKGAIVTIVMAVNDKPIARGTGFLVSPDGVIVTNYHVIETGNVAVVKFPDDTAFPVDGVLAADKVRDLAVIKIHGKTFRTLTLGDSGHIQVGEEVVAIGNPLGLEQTVSNGILSGVRTDKEAGGKFLQVTVPFTHGSSGGPLFNMMGEVIGITTLVYEGAGNLNFAIPVNDAKRLLRNQSAKLQNLPNEQSSGGATTTQRNESYDDLKNTLDWMQTTLSDTHAGWVAQYGNATETKLVEFNGCRVHFEVGALNRDPSDPAHLKKEPVPLLDDTLDLGDIDSERISSTKFRNSEQREIGRFDAHTWNDRKKIKNWAFLSYPDSLPEPQNELSFVLDADYSVRFEKAFKHAVKLCGGKPSTLKF